MGGKGSKKDAKIELDSKIPRPPRPTIMMSQPVSFRILQNEELKEWEDNLVKRVGLTKEEARLRRYDLPHYAMVTESGCPSSSGRIIADDCDEL